ncbi:hypothetical protein GIB67_030150 [Kingdonia uniflora]|uniref:Aminotransferase-like plant mobile domain-containing protein n=1 Tax=Kingdonia uniflora TaxID=39325 RepID=A0A7J7LEF4_9MAGN|nr:hypothetical protein GIB67_030150 [Kingdonia uniflora]
MVNDDELWEGILPIEFGSLPALQDAFGSLPALQYAATVMDLWGEKNSSIAYHRGALSFDEDVLSFELDLACIECHVEGDTSSLWHIAKAIHKLEILGINNGLVELDASIMGGQKDGKKIKVPLNSSDKLLKETRDLNFEVVARLVLRKKATSMKHDYSEISTVPYGDTWSISSNVRQLLPNIDFSHIKSGNVSIIHLRMYLTVVADREDDITIARTFILFMMGHLWFQTANDTVPLGYLVAVADLDSTSQYDRGSTIIASRYHCLDTAIMTGGAITGFVQILTYWFYEYYEVGHPLVKEDVKFSAYLSLIAWERGNKRKINDQATKLFFIGRYHIDHLMIETINWEPWLESEVSEIGDVLTVKLLSRKRMPLQVPNRNCEYYLGDRCWRQLEGEACIPLHPPLRLQLRRGRDVRVVPLPPGGGTRMRQCRSGPQTGGGGTSHRRWGTEDDSD